MNGRLLLSAPARNDRLRPTLAVIPECMRERVTNAAFKVTPSAWVIDTVGTVMGVTIVASSPKPGGGEPATLLAMITATAPAFCAFRAFVLKEQVPRSTSAILPFTAAALRAENTPQARPRFPAVSTTWATSAVTPGLLTLGPKAAVPTR